MTERTVRVICPSCAGTGHYRRDSPVSGICFRCNGAGAMWAALADPEAEALIADGERWRKTVTDWEEYPDPKTGTNEEGT